MSDFALVCVSLAAFIVACFMLALLENREPDDREREEAERYRSLMCGAGSLSDGTDDRG